MTVALAAQVRDEAEQVAPALRIERADGLVEEQQPRACDERLRDPEPLAHAAGVAGDPAPRCVGQADQPERLVDPGTRLAPSRPCSRPANSTSSGPVIQP